MEFNNKFTKIGVKNFRQFKDKIEFDIRPITIFTGPNNSGKSSLNKLIVFLSGIFKTGMIPGGDQYIKDLEYTTFGKREIEQIGDFKKNFNKNSDSETMSFYFTFEDEINRNEIEINLAYTLGNVNTYSHLEYKRAVILTEIIISINSNPILHLSKEDMYQHYNTKNLLKITKKKNQWGEVEDHLIRKYPIEGAEKYLWVSKLDNSFAETIREYLLAYRDSREEDEDILFQTENKELLIQSNLCKNLLKDKTKDRDDFIKTYIDFENKLLNAMYNHKFENLSTITPIHEFSEEFSERNESIFDRLPNEKKNYSVVRSKQFGEILQLSVSKFHNTEEKLGYEEIINILNSIESPLSPLFLDELKTTYDGDDVENDNFNVNYFNNIYKLIFKDILNSFLRDFENIYIKNIIGHYEIFKQYTPIQPYYYFDKPDVESPHLLKFVKMMFDEKENTFEGMKFNIKNSDSVHEMKFINKWMEEFKIGDELLILPIKNHEDIIGFSYNIKKGSNISPLMEEGLGVRKLISILIYILTSGKYPHIILEEPEANLHPSYQSKLAEIFADETIKERASTFERDSIIIETHSVYLIKKFQYLVAKGVIKKENVIIYYINSDENVTAEEKKVKEIKINETGGLTDTFGPGFFDETIRLQFDLLKLNQEKLN